MNNMLLILWYIVTNSVDHHIWYEPRNDPGDLVALLSKHHVYSYIEKYFDNSIMVEYGIPEFIHIFLDIPNEIQFDYIWDQL